MEGENAGEAAPDQLVISPLVDGLVNSNNPDESNPPNDVEITAQDQSQENPPEEVPSAEGEVSNRIENLLPSNENDNQPPAEANPSIESEPANATSVDQPQPPTETNDQPPQPPAETEKQPEAPDDQIPSSNTIENNSVQNSEQPIPDTSPIPQVRIPNTARLANTPRHFYPSMPQTARTGKSCRFVKTRPGTSRRNPYVSRKISSYAVPIVQLRSSYQSMDTQLHSLVANCNIEAISPELMMVYKRVDKAYDIFCLQANQLLSSQDPNATPRTQEKTSAIYKVSEDLVNEWVTFIRLFNNTISKGSTPFFQIISGRLSRILGMFRQLNDRFNVGMMKIPFTRDGMRRVDSEIVLLRRECNSKFRNDDRIDQDFANKVKLVIARVENVFRNSVTKATMCTAEIMRLKSELNVEASDLKTNVDAMVVFDKSAGLTRAEIANVNDVFNNLFQLMKIPLELKLKYEDEMSENEKTETKKEEEKTKNVEIANARPNGKVCKNNTMNVLMFENMI